MPLIQSADKHDRQLLPIHDINETLIKQIVWIRGRGRHRFLIIRHQSETIPVFVNSFVVYLIRKVLLKFIHQKSSLV